MLEVRSLARWEEQQVGKGEETKDEVGNRLVGQNPLPVREDAGTRLEVVKGLGEKKSRDEENPIRPHKESKE